MQKNKYLVTGGTGFAGSHLVEKLVDQKHTVVVPYRSINPSSYFFNHNLHKKTIMVPLDIRDFSRTHEILLQYHITHIFHLAAQALVDIAYTDPRQTLETNIMGTVNILESARHRSSIQGIIIASSDKAYGKLETGKYKESDALAGIHPYEMSKSATDLVATSYAKTYELPIATTRFGNIYGPGDLHFSRIIPSIMKSVIQNEQLLIRSDGTFVRDYVHVHDVADGFIQLMEKIESVSGEAFNFGSNDTYSVLDLIKTCQNKIDKKISYTITNSAKHEIPYQSLDWSKAKKMLNWKPKKTVSESIQEIYNWYEEILEHI